jgi:two-component system vancomycin resistance associated response regulator VraR
MGRYIRVLVIAPHDLSRNGLVALMSRPGSNIQVVGAFRELEEGEPELARLDPHVVLIDDVLPPTTEISEVLRRLHHSFSHLNMIVMSGRLHARYLQMLFSAGAAGYIYREDRLEESLIPGIETVSHGYFYASPRASGLLIGNRAFDNTPRVNQSDLEVLRLIDQGFTPKEIATALKLTIRTVYRIRNKLGVIVGAPTHEHLLVAAREKGLLSDDRTVSTSD